MEGHAVGLELINAFYDIDLAIVGPIRSVCPECWPKIRINELCHLHVDRMEQVILTIHRKY